MILLESNMKYPYLKKEDRLSQNESGPVREAAAMPRHVRETLKIRPEEHKNGVHIPLSSLYATNITYKARVKKVLCANEMTINKMKTP